MTVPWHPILNTKLINSSWCQIMLASDNEYVNQLIPIIKGARNENGGPQLINYLSQLSKEYETEIERVCNSNLQGFVTSVNQLLHAREGSVNLTSTILELNQSIQTSTENLAEQKNALVESRGVRRSIDDATRALQDCLEILGLANQVHELLGRKSHYLALRALDELQNVHIKSVNQFKIAELIQKSVPVIQRAIAEAVMTDLNTWLLRIRETSQFLGEVAFYHTEQRRSRQKERAEKRTYLSNFNLNSAIELVSDENEEFDILDNEDVQVDFSPLFECIHIHRTLGQIAKFYDDYATTRKQQKELLMPTSITLVDAEGSSLSELLEGIAGFAIIERATMRKVPALRSITDVN